MFFHKCRSAGRGLHGLFFCGGRNVTDFILGGIVEKWKHQGFTETHIYIYITYIYICITYIYIFIYIYIYMTGVWGSRSARTNHNRFQQCRWNANWAAKWCGVMLIRTGPARFVTTPIWKITLVRMRKSNFSKSAGTAVAILMMNPLMMMSKKKSQDKPDSSACNQGESASWFQKS